MIEIYSWSSLSAATQKERLARPSQPFIEKEINTVKTLLAAVKESGDAAVSYFTEQFDRVSQQKFLVSRQEIKAAETTLSTQTKNAIQFAAQQIEDYHRYQKQTEQTITLQKGVTCLRRIIPLQKVGLYVPGGTAPLVSTLLMLAMPARVAQCPLRIVCTPPQKNGCIDPHLLYAASLCQVEHIFKIGGAQAIAAMAYGTESIPKVDKIFGPGNRWVTYAKQLVALEAEGTAIDLPAGPSELLMIADEKADPLFVAADLLSQAEHNSDSQVILVTPSQHLAEQVKKIISNLVVSLPRQEIIVQALQHARIFLVRTLEEAISIANTYAAEHLIVNTQEPELIVEHIQHAGTIFVGPWSAESLGDYVTGSNHVLPTGAWVRSYSGLSLKDFTKTLTIQRITEDGIKTIGPSAQTLAELEGLQAHANAVKVRLEKLREKI